ncbi:hypothetical protein U1Q18_007727 [Sarracenia purpurea var. burkii]
MYGATSAPNLPSTMESQQVGESDTQRLPPKGPNQVSEESLAPSSGAETRVLNLKDVDCPAMAKVSEVGAKSGGTKSKSSVVKNDMIDNNEKPAEGSGGKEVHEWSPTRRLSAKVFSEKCKVQASPVEIPKWITVGKGKEVVTQVIAAAPEVAIPSSSNIP